MALKVILTLAGLGCFFGGIIGLIRPSWIKLSSRWQAAALWLFSGVLATAGGEFYPTKDAHQEDGATVFMFISIALICGFVIFLRVAFRAAALSNGAVPNECSGGHVERLAQKWAKSMPKYRNIAAVKAVSKQFTASENEERRKAGEAFIKKLGERRRVVPVRDAPVDLAQIEVAVRDVRVTPKAPKARKAKIGKEEFEQVAVPVRDHSSGWAGHISYVDAKGEHSERLIVVKRIEGYGHAETIFAWCCTREANRRFLVKGIKELYCAETGEILNPKKHFDLLASEGAIGTTDKSLADLITILVFLARCDGEFHPLEMESIDGAIEQHMIYFGGDRKSSRKAALNARKLAPDNVDVMNAIHRLGTHPQSALLAGIILDAAAHVVAADGVITDAEDKWQDMVIAALETIALCRAA